ncbi:PepSY domain-containing protein [Methylobacillus gramineus]|uniref:PepSY-associated TM helix domain-containing protein n=1 Tax=Methylobacillus gramineus TaxID=755169 RepID=UPI001CFFC11D|nr:PepSY domain-containing protein [Methylobacillus gramineus]MCB5185462.1 PepSY domain-containing protein [Methylobacillus gramineus]
MNIRLWYLTHKWTSLICTIFLIMLCITGLPLIFHEEIDHLAGEAEAPELTEDLPAASMDVIAQAALKKRPADVIRYMFWDAEEHPHVTLVSMAHSIDAPPDEFSIVLIDSRTAQVLDEPPANEGFMYIMLKLHTDMFAGLPGMLFLGLMGLLFVVAIISGIVLYHPFMRKLDFGTIRKTRSKRLKWLDVHNLLGVVTIVWVLVVGITGSINTLSQIIIGLWQQDQMAEMIAPYKGLSAPENIGSVQAALDTAEAAVTNMDIRFVAFPGTMFSSPHHYTVFLSGTTPVTSRLLQPALVDAQTGKLTETREMPWYVKTLLLSQPLHFGDYGQLPLKIIWTLFDLLTLVVLGTGVYLWWGRRKTADKRISDLEQLHRDYAINVKGQNS